MKIVVFGIGYVGLSNALLLANNNEVVLVDINEEKVSCINKSISPLSEDDIMQAFSDNHPRLHAVRYDEVIMENVDIVVVATPTDYSEDNNGFDTSSIENIMELISSIDIPPLFVIKSTVPVGFTDRMSRKYPNLKIIYNPEFLREGYSINDSEYPSRIIIGVSASNSEDQLLSNYVREVKNNIKCNADVHFMTAKEAESVKIFSNSYLAMRISFFNELDTFCEMSELDSKVVIDGVCADPRIGNYYNNPSFGYGGYCLPKDTMQMKRHFDGVPCSLIPSIVDSNRIRKEYIISRILNKVKNDRVVIGIYRLIAKKNSNNCRYSCMNDIVFALLENGCDIIIYEPSIVSESYLGCKIEHSKELFLETAKLIVANRLDEDVLSGDMEVYSRDVFFYN